MATRGRKRSPELKGETYHERKLESQARYDAMYTKMITVKMSLKYDADILDYFDTLENRQAFIKAAIRKAIAEAQNADKTHDPENTDTLPE